MCNNSCNQDGSSGKFLKKFCNFMVTSASSEEDPLFGALRRIFVPTIDQRAFSFLGQAFSSSCTCSGSDHHSQSCGCNDCGIWIELAEEMNHILANVALGRVIRDAVLVTVRLDRIGCELDRMALEDEHATCSSRNVDHWSEPGMSTAGHPSSPREKSCQTKGSRKRKASNMELHPEHPHHVCAASPCPVCSGNVKSIATGGCGGCKSDRCHPETPCNTKCRRTDPCSSSQSEHPHHQCTASPCPVCGCNAQVGTSGCGGCKHPRCATCNPPCSKAQPRADKACHAIGMGHPDTPCKTKCQGTDPCPSLHSKHHQCTSSPCSICGRNDQLVGTSGCGGCKHPRCATCNPPCSKVQTTRADKACHAVGISHPDGPCKTKCQGTDPCPSIHSKHHQCTASLCSICGRNVQLSGTSGCGSGGRKSARCATCNLTVTCAKEVGIQADKPCHAVVSCHADTPCNDEYQRLNSFRVPSQSKILIEVGSRSDKSCHIEIHPDPPCDTECRRTDSYSIALPSRTLMQKILEGCTDNSHQYCQRCGKLKDSFSNICSCCNSGTNNMLGGQICQTPLPCDPRKNFVRFKIETTTDKECQAATAVPVQAEICRKLPCRKINICEMPQRTSCAKVLKPCCVGVGPSESNNSCRISEARTEYSTRFLWNNQCDSFNTVSSSSDNSVFSSEQISCFSWDLGSKDSKTKLNCESQTRKMYSLAQYKKCFQQVDKGSCISSNKCSTPKTVNVKITSSDKSLKCQDTQTLMQKTQGRCLTRKLSCTDKQTCTEDVDDTVELTNIYINEISLCYCDDEDEPPREMGTNTKRVKSAQCSVSVDISTNTERVNVVESSTQAIFKDTKSCRCSRKESTECELRSFKFDDADVKVACKCDKVTTTDPKCRVIGTPAKCRMNTPCSDAAALDLAMQSYSSSLSERPQFTSVIRSKIGEIVDLNRRIREKMNSMRQTKELCSVSVQTLTRRESCRGNRNLVRVKLNTSMLAIPPSNECPKKLTSCKSVATEMSDRRIAKYRTFCDDWACENKKTPREKCSMKKIFTSTFAMSGRRVPKYRKFCDGWTCENKKAPREKCSMKKISSSTFDSDPPVKYQRCFEGPLPAVQESNSLELTVSSSLCSIEGNFDRGDFEEMYLLKYPRCRDERRLSRCSKKSNFLNYLSEHLTRDAFERCKKLLRTVLAKFLQGAKRLQGRKRGSRCRCRECRCAERMAELRLVCGDSCSSPRMWAGADARECSTRPPSARRDLSRAKSRARYARRLEATTARPLSKTARAVSTQDCRDRPEGRKKRRGKLAPVAPPWKKPYDIYEASSGSMPLSNTK